jgi:hypothetical protein
MTPRSRHSPWGKHLFKLAHARWTGDGIEKSRSEAARNFNGASENGIGMARLFHHAVLDEMTEDFD